MSSTKETLADIVADLRERAADLGRWKGTMWNHSEIEAELTEYADRIEAAAKRLKEELADAHNAIARLESELAEARRERDAACAEHALSSAPGNAAALREALNALGADTI